MTEPRRIVIVGAGMGGLTTAIYLAQRGYRVRLVEAGAGPGGLAAGLEIEGFRFDAGPYILLDRPGLEWAFAELGLRLDDHLELRRIEDLYQVESGNGPPIRLQGSLDATAEGFDATWAGSGRRYRRFVRKTLEIYRRLQPLQRVSRPGLFRLAAAGGWRDVPFLLRPLGSVLSAAGLPGPLIEAIAIWTRVAGQGLSKAPAPMAFVPALIHHHGAYYPRGGIAAVSQTLGSAAAAVGVELQYRTVVRRILTEKNRVRGVETDRGAVIPADAVVAGSGGVGAYLDLLQRPPVRARRRLAKLPLQSPGVCVYLAVRGATPPPYLRFRLAGDDGGCRLLVTPGAAAPELEREGWWPARLLAPMEHRRAEEGGEGAQEEFLDRVIDEPWWKEHVPEHRVLATRIPREWGAQYHLHRDSMNPVMTARFMRAGRLAHRSPWVRGLYLAGSATHPGQWVSFCAISGILAGRRVEEDFG